MRKAKFFFIMIVWGILGVASASWAQTGYRIEEERQVTSSREADISVVKVYGPDVLTDLAKRAIQEERPDVAIETYYEPLKNKVWIEGKTGAGYSVLSATVHETWSQPGLESAVTHTQGRTADDAPFSSAPEYQPPGSSASV